MQVSTPSTRITMDYNSLEAVEAPSTCLVRPDSIQMYSTDSNVFNLIASDKITVSSNDMELNLNEQSISINAVYTNYSFLASPVQFQYQSGDSVLLIDSNGISSTSGYYATTTSQRFQYCGDMALLASSSSTVASPFHRIYRCFASVTSVDLEAFRLVSSSECSPITFLVGGSNVTFSVSSTAPGTFFVGGSFVNTYTAAPPAVVTIYNTSNKFSITRTPYV